jgi:hypothetical protein
MSFFNWQNSDTKGFHRPIEFNRFLVGFVGFNLGLVCFINLKRI